MLIFDGSIENNNSFEHKTWIEWAMSLFEEGDRLYNLKNGEIISVPQSMKFIIETDSILHTSPSVISWMAIVNLNQNLVDNMELFKSMFVNSSLPSIFSMMKPYIQSMFSKIFEEILKIMPSLDYLPINSSWCLTIRFIETLDLLCDDVLKSYLIQELIEFDQFANSSHQDVSPLTLVLKSLKNNGLEVRKSLCEENQTLK